MKRLLAVDIGNSWVHLALFVDGRVKKRFRFATDSIDYFSQLKKISSRVFCDELLVASVVPGALSKFLASGQRIFRKKIKVVGKDMPVPLVNRYRYPSKLGIDRLLNAYATLRLYGAPAIIIDYGTAVTFDILSKKKEFLGGLILPGLNVSLNSLNQNTSFLPKIRLSLPKEFIGRDTQQCILSGVVNGMVLLTNALVTILKEKIGNQATVVATGGDASIIKKSSQVIDVLDKDLTLKAICLLSQSL